MLRTMNRALTTLRSLAARLATSPRTSTAAAGAAIGISAWIFLQTFVLTLGFSPETNLAALLAIGISLPLGGLLARRLPVLAPTGLAAVLVAVWLVLQPSIVSLVLAALDKVPAAFLADPASRIACLLAAGLAMLMPPMVALGVSMSHPAHGPHRTVLGVSIAAGLLIVATLVGPFVRLDYAAYGLAAVLCVAWGARQWFGGNIAACGQIVPHHGVPENRWLRAARLTTCAAAGLIAGILARVLAQLSPASFQLIAGGAAGLIGGYVLGAGCQRWLGRSVDRPAGFPLWGATAVSCAALVPLATFERLISWQFATNAGIAIVGVVLGIRLILVGSCFLLLGFGLGLGRRDTGAIGEAGGNLVIFLTALAAAPWLLSWTGPDRWALASAGLVFAVNLPGLRRRRCGSWRGVLCGAAAAGLLILLAARTDRYNPARAAALLFDTSALSSWNSGLPDRLLTACDDTRLLALRETPRGTLTAWRSRGSIVSLRRDGVPLGMTTDRPALCPLPAAEVLRVVMPIVLHEDPESLLILSDPAGVAKTVATEFPLRQIVCYDGLSAGSRAECALPAPPPDQRLRRSASPPGMALLIEEARYDLVVSSPGHAAVLDNASQFTVEYYRQAARRLNPGGFFCQHFQCADFGSRPLRDISRTMLAAFESVAAISIGGGDIALIGTNGDSPLPSDDLEERLQRSHVRRVLARLGWDWSMPLSLQVIEPENFAQLAGADGVANRAASGYLAHWLPLEMMRWGPKGAEMQQATASVTGPLVAVSVAADDRKAVSDRIRSVAQGQQLMTQYPDQPWAYRKAVRTHLKESPRSTIEKVDGDLQRVLHPAEKRRLEYFKALDQAIRSLDAVALARLESFAEPYDPLITYFLHHEIAPLYGQLGPSGRIRELRHRLHATYFASPSDRSVRNIIASLELLATHPTTMPDPARRFDHLNALVALLLARWETRGGGIPDSPEVAMADVEKSLDALAAVLPVMEDLAAEAGISRREWENRRDATERMIIRPLRDYRAKLLPHVRTAGGSRSKTDALRQAQVPAGVAAEQ